MKQAPGWLPYRIRHALDQHRLQWAVRGLNKTKPRLALDPAQADAEVHMLLCQRDLRIGVLALKSLLRFNSPRWSVTITDDGSLTDSERGWVREHIPAARWLRWPDRDHRDTLDHLFDGRPRLRTLYHSRYAPVAKLVHPMGLARCDRVLVLDPDTAFFQPPQCLVAWARSQDPPAWYMHDHQDESQAIPAVAEEGFGELQDKLTPTGRRWNLQHRLFNSGLLAYQPKQLDLDLAEGYLHWLETAPERYKQGKSAIWFGPWTPEQTCYHVMFALADQPSRPLGEDYHLGGESGHVFNHFLRHYLVQDNTLKMLRGLISGL